MRDRIAGAGAAFVAAALAGCGETTAPPPGPPPAPPPASIAIVSGDGQETTAGDSLPARPLIQVSDRNGVRSGMTVRFNASAIQGWGWVGDVVTDGQGQASVRWPVNGHAGLQYLSAQLPSKDSVVFTARIRPGPPDRVVECCVNSEPYATVGTALAVPPHVVVQDAYSNALANQTVRFHVESGGGSIADSVQITDDAGEAALGGWTLGPTAAVNTVSATVDGSTSLVITRLGAPDSIAVVAGDSQRVNVGTRVPIAPSVRVFGPGGRRLGAGFQVNWDSQDPSQAVSQPALTDATGIARLDLWQVGPEPRIYRVRAVSFGKETFLTAVVARPPIARIIPLTGNGTTVFAGNMIPARPTFRVVDSLDQPIGAQTVTFEASDGGLLTIVGESDGNGEALVSSWRAGPGSGVQFIRALEGNRELGRFTTTAVAPPTASAFTIDVRFRGATPSSEFQKAFTDAAARWATALVGDLPDIPLDRFGDPGGCFPALHETIDDLVVFVSIESIDGPGETLAGSRPCVVRAASRFLPVVSKIVVDSADLAALSAQDLGTVAMHELGHALGFGGLWTLLDLLRPDQLGFLGPSAIVSLTSAADAGFFYPESVPIEGDGGPGTALVHWARQIGPELMTGFLQPNASWSVVTLGSMRDLGYVVNDAAADPFTPGLSYLRAGPSRPLVELALPGPIYSVGPSGKTVRRLR